MSKSIKEYRTWSRYANTNELKLVKSDRIQWIKCLGRLLAECPAEPTTLKEIKEANDVVSVLDKEIARRNQA